MTLRPDNPIPFSESTPIREFVESADQAMVVVDGTGEIALANGLAERLFGYTRTELVGLPVDVLVPERIRQRHGDLRREYSAHPRLRQMGGGTGFQGMRKGGGEFPAEISLSPLETTEGTYVLTAIRDVTASRRADYLASHFMAVVESTHDAIIGRDLDGTVISWNPGAELLFGYTEAEMCGQTMSTLDAPGRDTSSCDQSIGADPVETQDTVRVHKDGNLVDVSITNSPIVGMDGTLRGSSIIARDISDRRKAERLKDGFLSLVSHELRTPLSAIVAHVELLLDEDLLSEHRQRFVEVVHRNSLRLERLVGDLLFVAQLESADLTVTMTDVDIVTIAKDAVEAAAPRAGGSGVDLRFEPGGHPVRMVGDAGRLGQAVDNLISNAIKYSPDGGAVCVRVLPDAAECIIEVQDEGVGIAFDEQEHLFERFYRAPTAASLHVQGIGLGLLIVKKIVDAHGGHVSVRSEPGSGATFRMMLPLDPTVRRSTPSAVPALARSSAR
jgi:PAS domain S-box-containing protein